MSTLRKLKALPAVVWPTAMVLLVAALAVAVELGANVVRLDHAANQTVQAHAGEPLTGWVFFLTALGATPVLVAVTLSAAIGLTLRGRWRSAIALALAYAVTDATVTLVKLVVERPRPDESLTHAGGFSFPSGHSATSMAVYGCLAIALARAARGFPRVAIVLAAAGLVVLIGLSRIYLGVHYASDVVAGWTTGGAIVIAAWLIVGRLRPLPAPA